MGEQKENLTRVSRKIAGVITAFYDIDRSRQFHMQDLQQYVKMKIPDTSPDSPSRILRDLRKKGVLDYKVIKRKDSLYQFLPPSESPRKPTRQNMVKLF